MSRPDLLIEESTVAAEGLDSFLVFIGVDTSLLKEVVVRSSNTEEETNCSLFIAEEVEKDVSAEVSITISFSGRENKQASFKSEIRQENHHSCGKEKILKNQKQRIDTKQKKRIKTNHRHC